MTTFRNRATLSCKNCKIRKVKCDRRLPCNNCDKTVRNCSYDDPNSIITGDASLYSKLQNAERELAGLRRLSKRYRHHLRASDTETKSDGRSSTIGIFERSDGLERYHNHQKGQLQNELTLCLQYLSLRTAPQEGFTKQQRYELCRIASLCLPPKTVIYTLFSRLMVAHPCALVLFDPPGFIRDCNAIWSNSLSLDMFLQTTTRPFTFVVVLAMVSLSLRTYNDPNDPELVAIEQVVCMERETYRQFLHQGIQAAFRIGRYREFYDFDLVQALLLDIGSTDIGSSCNRPITFTVDTLAKAWTTVSLLVYIAQSMGFVASFSILDKSRFHRDPSYLGLSVIEGEKRRRLWWLIQIYDMYEILRWRLNCRAMSYSQGIPAHVDLGDTDCQLPQYNTAIDGDSPEYENAVEWFVIFVQLTTMFSPLNRAYHARYQSTKDIQKVHDELASLEQKIPAYFRPDFNTESSEIQWRQILLESLLSRALLCHHLPYLHNNKLPQSRYIALEAAARNMRIFCKMDSLSSTDMQYRWFGEMWMFSAPLLATVLLATDLVASKSTDELAWDLVEGTETALRQAPELQWIPNSDILLDTICQLRSERLFGDDFFGRIMGAEGLETVGWEWISGYM